MNELKTIKSELVKARQSSVMDRYFAYKILSCKLLSYSKTEESINLCKELMNLIYELRYEMAYNKATESGNRDAELKEIWESLNSFV